MTRSINDIGIALVSCPGAGVLEWQQNLGHKLVWALLNAEELKAGSGNLRSFNAQDELKGWRDNRVFQLKGLRLLSNYAASAIAVIEYIDHRADEVCSMDQVFCQAYTTERGAKTGKSQLWAFMQALRVIVIHRDPPLIESRFDPDGQTSHLGVDSGRLVVENPDKAGLIQYGRKRPRLDIMVTEHVANLRKYCFWYCQLEATTFAAQIGEFQRLWDEYQQALLDDNGDMPHPSFVELAAGIEGPLRYLEL